MQHDREIQNYSQLLKTPTSWVYGQLWETTGCSKEERGGSGLNSSTWKAVAGGSQWVQGQPGLQRRSLSVIFGSWLMAQKKNAGTVDEICAEAGGTGIRCYCLVSTEVLFVVMKSLWQQWWQMHSIGDMTNVIEPYTKKIVQMVGQSWWHMPLIPATEKQRQAELCEFKWFTPVIPDLESHRGRHHYSLEVQGHLGLH